MDNRPIGFCDSGVGGLTCIRALQKILPNERVIFYGDTARTPYGSKSIDTIKKFSNQIVDYLIEHDVKMIVIACNTISATCLETLRRRHPNIPIVSVIEPIANRIATEEQEEVRIGVIATKVTVESGAYSNIITGKNKKVKIFSKACPVFVPLIEEGIIDNEIMDLSIKYYLDDFIVENNIDKIVLGCTHYPFLKKNFGRLYPDLKLLNPSEDVIYEVKRILEVNNMLAGVNNDAMHLCYASDISDNLKNMIDTVFDEEQDVKIEFKKFQD